MDRDEDELRRGEHGVNEDLNYMLKWSGVIDKGRKMTKLGWILVSLSGTIPAEIGALLALTFLTLDSNNLSGELPPELGNLTSLTELWLHKNSFSSAVTSTPAKLTYPETILLQGNNFTTDVPPPNIILEDKERVQTFLKSVISDNRNKVVDMITLGSTITTKRIHFSRSFLNIFFAYFAPSYSDVIDLISSYRTLWYCSPSDDNSSLTYFTLLDKDIAWLEDGHRDDTSGRRSMILENVRKKGINLDVSSMLDAKSGSLKRGRGSPSASPLLLALVCCSLISACGAFTFPSRVGVMRSGIHSLLFNDDEGEARSQFGRKSYWDEMYQGMGDFSADEYSWYFGFDVIKYHVEEHVDPASEILMPGIGNDPMLLDAYQKGYKNIVAFDYSEHAIERQLELLSYEPYVDTISLSVQDARILPEEWSSRFTAVIEKGCLDAVYLSGEGQVELAAQQLARVIAPNGVLLSVSGVVPASLREAIFPNSSWEWIRDGASDLKAGVFIMRRRDFK